MKPAVASTRRAPHGLGGNMKTPGKTIVFCEEERMRAVAPLALTGLLSFILLEILKLVMEPLVEWLQAMLTIGLKFVLSLVLMGLTVTLAVIALGIAIYVIRRIIKSRNEDDI